MLIASVMAVLVILLLAVLRLAILLLAMLVLAVRRLLRVRLAVLIWRLVIAALLRRPALAGIGIRKHFDVRAQRQLG